MNLRDLRIMAVAGLVAFGAACGDDDSDTGSAADTEADAGSTGDGASDGNAPTKDEYIAQADDICRRYLTEMDELSAESEELALADEPDPIAAQKFFRKLFDLGRQTLAEVRELTLPEGDAGAQIDAAFDDTEQLASDLEQRIATPEGALEYFTEELQRVFAGGEEEGTSQGATEPDPADAIDQKLADLGFQVCFSGGDE